MSKVEVSPEDKAEIVCNADGPSLQSLIEKIFKWYIQSDGHPSDKGKAE